VWEGGSRGKGVMTFTLLSTLQEGDRGKLILKEIEPEPTSKCEC